MKGLVTIFNKTVDVKDNFNTLLAIEDEQKFLYHFAQMRARWTYDEVMTSVTEVHTLLVQMMTRQWLEGLPVVLGWACQFWNRSNVWKSVVGGICHDSTCDWLINYALQDQPKAKTMLETGTQELAIKGEAFILSYWIGQSFKAVGSFNLSEICYVASAAGKVDNVAVIVRRMNSLQVAGVMVRAGEHNKKEIIDFLYTPELGRLVAHVTGPKERGSMSDGMMYLRQRIAGDADRAAILQAIGPHTGPATKVRKI